MKSNIHDLKPMIYEVHKLDENMNVEVICRGDYDKCKNFLVEHFGHLTVEEFVDLDIMIS